MLRRSMRASVIRPRQGYPGFSLQQTLEALRLTTGLQLCLDAGDAASYDPAVQTTNWLDTSGNGYDFFRGVDGSATATDPTFNGNAGGKSSAEYWSFDGGDNFRYDTTNEAWMDALHKDSAAFTLAAWVYPGSAASQSLFGTSGSSASSIGIAWFANASNGNGNLTIANGTGTFARSLTQNVGVVASAWQFLAVSVDEGASVGFHFRNGTKGADASVSYTTPSASAATRTAEIAATGNGTGPMTNTSRMAMLSGWSRALSAAELTAIFNATRGRFAV